MSETIETISNWALSTFGPECTDHSILARANLELAELAFKVHQPKRASKREIIDEAADVCIVLARYAVRRDYTNEMLATGTQGEMFWFGARHNDIAVLVSDAMRIMAGLLEGGRCCPALYELHARMYRIIELCGGVAEAAIDAKMVVNRGRKWRLDGNGHGQHIDG